MTNEHTSLEKYTFLTLFERVAKGLCVRGELETEQTATYWPPVPLTITALLFSFCWGAQTGVLRAQALCWELILTASNCNTNSNKLIPTNLNFNSGTGLYYCLTSTCFLWASHLHRIQPVHGKGNILISSTGCTVSRLTVGLKVNMLQSSHNYFSKFHMWNFSSRPSPSPSHTHFTNTAPGQ